MFRWWSFMLVYVRAEDGGNTIHIYDGKGTGEPLHTLDKLHYKPVILITVCIKRITNQSFLSRYVVNALQTGNSYHGM